MELYHFSVYFKGCKLLSVCGLFYLEFSQDFIIFSWPLILVYMQRYINFALQTSKSIQNTTIFTSAWQWTTKQFNTKGCKLLSVCGLFWNFSKMLIFVWLATDFLKWVELLAAGSCFWSLLLILGIFCIRCKFPRVCAFLSNAKGCKFWLADFSLFSINTTECLFSLEVDKCWVKLWRIFLWNWLDV